MTPFVVCGDPIDDRAFATIRRRAIFECCKWDPQVGDVAALSPIPLLITPETMDELACLAEGLAREILAAEFELTTRPDLWRELGLPSDIRSALGDIASGGPPRGVARLARFDFHPTPEGWRISEANTDVPGGFVEAQGFTALVAEHTGLRASGAPAAAYAEAVRQAVAPGGRVALVHATAYSDDRQVMTFLSRELERRGLVPVLVSPEQLRWKDGRADIVCDWAVGPAAAVLRFFPAEWLPNCSGASGWRSFFAGARTPLGNPATALLTQSKRLPLVWDRLATPMDTWRALLPETSSPPRAGPTAASDWIAKPTFGRVGDGVGIPSVTPAKEQTEIETCARRDPRDWVLQRRFDAVALPSAAGPRYPCLGVYTIDARAAGIYGRVARRPLIDHLAQDAAVLVTAPAPVRPREVLV